MIVAVDICQSKEALATIVALVIGICAIFILLLAEDACVARMASAVLPFALRFYVNV